MLLDADGHLLLTDFGLSKDEVTGPKGATTFCGTPEYLGACERSVGGGGVPTT